MHSAYITLMLLIILLYNTLYPFAGAGDAGDDADGDDREIDI